MFLGCAAVGFLLGMVLVFSSSSSEAAVGNNYTYISQADGKNELGCIGGGLEYPCLSLSYVAEYANNASFVSINIIVQGPTLVDDNVTFSHFTELTLEGSSTDTTVTCNCKHCGLVFEDSQDIDIRLLHFTNCGVNCTFNAMKLKAAVVVYACTNFSAEETNFTSNFGTGLLIVDTHGSINISRCNFEDNSRCDCSNAKGLHIVFTDTSVSVNTSQVQLSNYFIENCRVRNNRFEKAYEYKKSNSGGGISLWFTGNTSGNTVTVRDTTVEKNLATWGGGMMIMFRKDATNNNVILDNVLFRKNNASQHGGGLNIGYIDRTSDPPITNLVVIENCNFTRNHARSGGGTAIFASQTTCARENDHDDNTLVFRSCMWEDNTGYFSSAMDISPFSYDTLGDLYFPHPKFVGCAFTSNHVRSLSRDLYQIVNVGTFVVYGFEVLFKEWVEFRDHTSTALHVTDGTVTFLPNTSALFYNNLGYQGGGLAMFGASLLLLLSNTNVTFVNNSAFTAGGAIYHSTQNHHDFISSRACFITNGSRADNTVGKERAVLVFRGNSAGQANKSGQSIFATTFLPCYFEQFGNVKLRDNKILAALERIADFDFGDEDKEMALSSSGIAFSGESMRSFSVIPGKDAKISLTMIDEFNNTAPSVYRVVSDDVCHIDRQYMLDKIGIRAVENTSCDLQLVALSFRELSLKVNVSVMTCPPGFYLENEACICSAYSIEHAYFGISTCYDQMSFAYLTNGFWAGYDEDKHSLLTAPCPSSFCKTQVENDISGIKLPDISLPQKLYDAVCHPHRTGWLCGRCQPNYTVYYHSPTYRCGLQKLCIWGTLFYFLSEIVPIIIMFSVIALFDIRFTTGTASALVFFAQIIDTVTLGMKWNAGQPKYITILSIGYKVIYGLFNFEFFNLEMASFCLWKNATILDMITIKYASVVFAFVLLLMIVLFLNYCTANKCSRVNRNITRVGKNRSSVHSMSAVLVICYGQCTNISLQLLAKAKLQGAGRETRHYVTLYGGVQYFQTEHLVYALAACFCLFTIVAAPPVLLVVYPGYLSLFSFCKLNETYLARLMSQVFIKFKPFFDSFQGCYRDKLRFFSGLFFLSRVVILAVNAFTTTTLQSIIIMEIIILLLLGLYALSNPFQTSVDNINTGLILLNMSVIGCLTMLAYSQDSYDDQRQVVIIALTVRLILLYLPIMSVCFYVIKTAANRFLTNRYRKLRKSHDKQSFSEATRKPREDDHGYVPFQEVTIENSVPSPDTELSYSYRNREDLLLST